ncbi:MAG: hypothetical protein GTN86_10695 [Xanthomonadales bacterium]|nr:hypothetical protein [Xanthomonadales bacterium]NIN58618.1 hypothetical protein [Xanthomonadales bacterium]NIN73907.1 hypothetical protein [Xanthomonadales bacterium]NIO12376.1 hypothetical protein [Xanthomonadales bacterium]NIP11011.1 hypothetical protein [Xanthomonadales bacterium]
MTEIAALKMGHLLCLVYWLGADLGVFYASYAVTNERLSREARLTAARTLFALDLAPRVCMTLMLPFGVHLSVRLGLLPAPNWVVPVTWLLCLGWLAMVLTLHAAKATRAARLLTPLDFGFRLALIAALAAIGGYSLVAAQPLVLPWVGLKLLVFGALVLAGVLIRIRLRPFGPAFARLARDEMAPGDHLTIRRSLAGTRPFVLVIWLGLLVETALGLHLIRF